MKKYLARLLLSSPSIQIVDVERESESSVWLDGRRCAKRSSYENYCDTWQEAHQLFVNLAEQEKAHAESRLFYATRNLNAIAAMKEQQQ